MVIMIQRVRSHHFEPTSSWFVSFIFFAMGSGTTTSSTVAVRLDISSLFSFSRSFAFYVVALSCECSVLQIDEVSWQKYKWNLWNVLLYPHYHEEDAPRETMTWAPVLNRACGVTICYLSLIKIAQMRSEKFHQIFAYFASEDMGLNILWSWTFFWKKFSDTTCPRSPALFKTPNGKWVRVLV